MQHFQETIHLLESSNFFYIICVNMEGRYSHINPHYQNTFSKIHGSLLNQPYQITMHPDDTKTCAEVAERCFANPNKVYPATIRKHDGKGGYVITQWEYRAMFDNANIPAGVFCIGYDITQFVVQQVQLTEALTNIKNKEVRLKQIAFTQSHHVRLPLSNILGLVDILSKIGVDERLKNILNMLEESARQLDTRIKEIVDNTYEGAAKFSLVK